MARGYSSRIKSSTVTSVVRKNWRRLCLRRNPTRMGFALGRFVAHGPHGIALARMRRLQAPPAWNCTWKIFLALAGITSPTRMELHLEDFFALGRITNPTEVELHLEDFSPLRENPKPRALQTPPGWNCTWKIFCP